jgi:hypothetical protein
MQHLPHWFHIVSAGATLGMELVLVWMAFLPRRWRIACFFLVTAWQVVVIATANYAFLNYIVLVLAFLLLDDEFLRRFVPERWRTGLGSGSSHAVAKTMETIAAKQGGGMAKEGRRRAGSLGLAARAVMLTWVFYATTVLLMRMVWQEEPLPTMPAAVLDPFRIANQYGLFAVMTPHRYEIEFQGSNDGQRWVAYPFRYKPQDVRERPRIYAPYQPRFDWNLWFASLGSWSQNPMVPRTEELLLEGDRDVLGLFRGDPFAGWPPKYMRAVLWQYWFSTPEQKRLEGIWWTRQYLGTYTPTLERLPDGRYGVVAESSLSGPPAP